MNITEIVTNPPRDEYLDQHSYNLANAETVASINGLQLKKSASQTEVHYGLFDKKNQLVGYFSLEYAGKGRWEVALVQLAQAYKGLGLGTFFYDYAVMNDKLTVISDGTNTGGPHGSKKMWERLWQNRRYDVKGIDLKTNTVFDATPDMIYNNDFNTRWIAYPPTATINEAMAAIQSTMKKRFLVWYGPGTTTEDYFNW